MVISLPGIGSQIMTCRTAVATASIESPAAFSMDDASLVRSLESSVRKYWLTSASNVGGVVSLFVGGSSPRDSLERHKAEMMRVNAADHSWIIVELYLSPLNRE